MPPRWNAFLLGALAVHLVGLALGPDIHAWAWQLLGWAAVAVLVWRSRQMAGPEASPWRWLALGAGLLLAGGVAHEIHAEIANQSQLFPSAGDFLYHGGYLALVVGLFKLVRLRTALLDRGDVIDSLIVTAAAALIAWVTILAPFVRNGEVRLIERVLAVNYSILTLVLVLAITRLSVGPGLRSPSYYLLATATALIFVSDVFLTLQTTDTFTQDVYELLAPLSYGFVAASALHPSVGQLTARPEYVVPTLTWKRIITLGGALLMGPAVMVFQAGRGSDIDLPVVVTGWVVLSLLVLARLGLLIREEERAAKRERVLRDLGSVLVVGGTEQEMRSAALWSVLELTDGLSAGRAMVLTIDDGMVEVEAAVGRRAADIDGVRFAVSAFPREVREALTQRYAINLENVRPFERLDPKSSEDKASVVVAPLVARGSTTGAIIVASATPIDRGVVSALTSVAMEVSLAIESAALTADLHRRKSDRRFRALVENSSEIVWVLDDGDRGQFASPAVERLLGRPEAYFLGPISEELIHSEDRAEFKSLITAAREGVEEDDPYEIRLRHIDSTFRWFEMRARDLTHEAEIGGLVVTARDITDRKLAEQRLARSEARFRSLVQNSSDVVAVIDEGGAITYVSPAVNPMLGFVAEELVGSNIMRLLPADEVTRAMQLLEGITPEPFGQFNIEMRLRDRAGVWRNVDVTISDMRDETAVQGIVLNVRDVTVRRALEEDLQRKALHDELTGLGNRVQLEQRLQRALSRSEVRLDQVAVLMIDLDDFKEINDSLGHRSGDQLLLGVAERIRACLRVSDVAARLGGDEFGILLEDTYDDNEVFAVAERLLLAISQPFVIDGRHITTTASIGIVIDSDRSSNPDALLRAADVAMYLAKERGKGRYEVFQESAHSGAFERLELKAALSDAIRHGGLELHYQPIVHLESARIVGCEALVRWNHPVRGLMPPGDFIPLAEDSGLIVALGKWVLNEACRQMGQWQTEHPLTNDLRVSINLSVRQIDSASLVADIAEAVEYGGITPTRLTLEITESLVMNDDADTLARLQELRSQGITLAVDDFGTGYSSLGYIQQFPLDVIKIDRSFVSRLDDAASGTHQLVRTILELAQGLDAITIAEGIETKEQLDALKTMGCQYGQGFYFSRPLPADDFVALVEAAPEVRREIWTADWSSS